MKNEIFSRYHPIVNLAFFAAVLGMTMFIMQPVYLIISLACACAYLFYLKGRKGMARQVGYLLPILLAMAVMCIARKIPMFSIYGVSILGAAAHNIGQILAAMVLMNSYFIGAYLPYLLVVALFTGFATGAACAGVQRILKTVNIS